VLLCHPNHGEETHELSQASEANEAAMAVAEIKTIRFHFPKVPTGACR